MKEGRINEKKLKKALIKKALGFDATEVVEEYSSSEEGEIKLSKKKITKKVVPPDMTALRLLMEEDFKDLDKMSDEELEKEKEKLLKLLKEEEISD
ncbi:MAG: hypothetical protein KBS91_00610 [Firmicutes bacterium]|nr:hypothetical protein [Candidatus Caballimonas caccae]